MRIMLAGTGSGCGKTTASLLVMTALLRRGLAVAPYKVGPDYIDPEFHAEICGRPAHNLDSWLMQDATMNRLLQNDADISVIEGVMGYYDGLNPLTLQCSSWDIAVRTQTPVILVVDASGGAASIAATVKGFLTLRPDSRIAGVLVNRVSGEKHYALARSAIEHYTHLPCVGYLTRQSALTLPSRHLGLVPAAETADLTRRVTEAAITAEKTLDLDLLLALAAGAPELPAAEAVPAEGFAGYRLAVAWDEAFHFYYTDNLDMLRRSGMELCFFSPLHDASLPDHLNGLYIGGGFPEVFATRLAANRSMLTDIRTRLTGGLHCYSECGGLMYLGQAIDDTPMVGFLPVKCHMTDRLQRFGYVTVTDRSGLTFPAHEFHHAAVSPQPEADCAFLVQKASDPRQTWTCGYTKAHTLGAFAHVHWGDSPALIRRFFA